MVFEEAADRIPKAQQAFPLLDIQGDGHPLQPVNADGPFLTDLAIQRAAFGASSSRSLVASSTVISPAWTFARTSSFFTGSFSFNGLSGSRPVLAPARTRCDRFEQNRPRGRGNFGYSESARSGCPACRSVPKYFTDSELRQSDITRWPLFRDAITISGGCRAIGPRTHCRST